MKRLLALIGIAVLLTAFAACNGEAVKVDATENSTEATIATEAATTTEAPISTTEATTPKATTIKSATTTERIEANIPLQSYMMDENGFFYLEHGRWTKDTFEPEMLYGSSSQHREPSVQVTYATMRVKFQYAGQDWMIQLWKGRYGLLILGGEIAVLKKPVKQQAEHYLPAEPTEELAMSMDVYQHSFLDGSTKKLLSRSTKSDWWFNGFLPASFHEHNKKEEIILVGSITFPEKEMQQAFEASLAKAGFKRGIPDSKHPETYSSKDNTITFSWQNIDQDSA